MNISCRIANADTQCGRITNPPERGLLPLVKKEDELSQFIKGRILQISAIDSFYPPNYNKKNCSGGFVICPH